MTPDAGGRKMPQAAAAQSLEFQNLRTAVLRVADGLLSDPCWCGEEWWEAHDAHADEREHSQWCADLRKIVIEEDE